MIKLIFPIILTQLGLSLMAQNYTAANAHDDSLFVYQVYKDQISFLDSAAKTRNYQAWYNRSNHDDSITTCIKLRLKKWNKENYKVSDTREFEGFGTAYTYPAPGAIKKAKFSITDQQTKFITRPDGRTKSPYVQKTYFDEGGMAIAVEQLDPLKN